MPNRPARTHFRFATAAALLTVASALLLAAAWLLIPNLIGDQDGSGCAVVLAALTVWVSALIGIVPVALLQPRGLMPAVHGYFIGAAIRVVVCILATVLAVRSATVATAPWVATLLGMYLPLLFLEAAMVGRSIWDFSATTTRPSGLSGTDARRDHQGNFLVETLR